MLTMKSFDPKERIAYEMNWAAERTHMTSPFGGNFGWRIDKEKAFVTPGHADKRLIESEDIVTVNLKTGEYDGGVNSMEPTSELKMMLEIWKRNPNKNIIAHLHLENAVLASLADPLIIQELVDEFVTMVPETFVSFPPGSLKVATEFKPMWSDELADQVSTLMSKGAKVVLMRKHGPIIIENSMSAAMDGLILFDSIVAAALKAHAARGNHLTFEVINTKEIQQMTDAREVFQRSVAAHNT
jgi:ribulose-5-phosphate 4-epimerase/fuculose-1-phosphate aldolase